MKNRDIFDHCFSQTLTAQLVFLSPLLRNRQFIETINCSFIFTSPVPRHKKDKHQGLFLSFLEVVPFKEWQWFRDDEQWQETETRTAVQLWPWFQHAQESTWVTQVVSWSSSKHSTWETGHLVFFQQMTTGLHDFPTLLVWYLFLWMQTFVACAFFKFCLSVVLLTEFPGIGQTVCNIKLSGQGSGRTPWGLEK